MAWSLQPLRIPHGWQIEWNTFSEDDPTEPANANGYYFGGANLFFATCAGRRVAIDIEWRTEIDRPAVGLYRMRILRMVEVGPTAARRGDLTADPLEVDWQDPVIDFYEASRPKLIAELEAWLSGARDPITH